MKMKMKMKMKIKMKMKMKTKMKMQEAGRAGRDGLRSECVVFYKSADACKYCTYSTYAS